MIGLIMRSFVWVLTLPIVEDRVELMHNAPTSKLGNFLGLKTRIMKRNIVCFVYFCVLIMNST